MPLFQRQTVSSYISITNHRTGIITHALTDIQRCIIINNKVTTQQKLRPHTQLALLVVCLSVCGVLYYFVPTVF